MNKVELNKWYAYQMSEGDGNTRSEGFKTLWQLKTYFGFDHSLSKEGKGIYHYGHNWIMTGKTAEEQGFTKWDLVD